MSRERDGQAMNVDETGTQTGQVFMDSPLLRPLPDIEDAIDPSKKGQGLSSPVGGRYQMGAVYALGESTLEPGTPPGPGSSKACIT